MLGILSLVATPRQQRLAASSLALSLSVVAPGAMTVAQEPAAGAGTGRRTRTRRRRSARGRARARPGVRRGRDRARENGVRAPVWFLSRERRTRSCRRTRPGAVAGRPRRYRGQGTGRLSARRTSGTRDAGIPEPDRSADHRHRGIPARAARSRAESRRDRHDGLARRRCQGRSGVLQRTRPLHHVSLDLGTSPGSARNTIRRRSRAGW